MKLGPGTWLDYADFNSDNFPDFRSRCNGNVNHVLTSYLNAEDNSYQAYDHQ